MVADGFYSCILNGVLKKRIQDLRNQWVKQKRPKVPDKYMISLIGGI